MHISLFFLEKKEWNLKCFHSFREMKSEFFLLTHFQSEKWNENALKWRSRVKSEMKRPRDRAREVKLEKNSGESRLSQGTAGQAARQQEFAERSKRAEAHERRAHQVCLMQGRAIRRSGFALSDWEIWICNCKLTWGGYDAPPLSISISCNLCHHLHSLDTRRDIFINQCLFSEKKGFFSDAFP